jgi:hypothetical protein
VKIDASCPERERGPRRVVIWSQPWVLRNSKFQKVKLVSNQRAHPAITAEPAEGEIPESTKWMMSP